MKYSLPTLSLAAISVILTANVEAAVLITQYYEGPSTNKWIEITNTGTTDVDLGAGGFKLGLWTNANAEGYKTDVAPSQTVNLTGTLTAGSSFVYGNSANTTPTYVTATANSNTVINFNGNDSIALWTGVTFVTVNVVDAIAFTNSGNEGVDKSFVRLNESEGWNTVAGSDVLDFNSVWQAVTLAVVDGASVGTDERLGFSSIPEPSAYLLGTIGLFGLLRRRRF